MGRSVAQSAAAANRSSPRPSLPSAPGRTGSTQPGPAKWHIAGGMTGYRFSATIPIIGGADRNAPGSCSCSRHSAWNDSRSASVSKPASTSFGT